MGVGEWVCNTSSHERAKFCPAARHPCSHGCVQNYTSAFPSLQRQCHTLLSTHAVTTIMIVIATATAATATGRTLCKLHLAPAQLHADINGDGVIDHVAVGSAGAGLPRPVCCVVCCGVLRYSHLQPAIRPPSHLSVCLVASCCSHWSSSSDIHRFAICAVGLLQGLAPAGHWVLSTPRTMPSWAPAWPLPPVASPRSTRCGALTCARPATIWRRLRAAAAAARQTRSATCG